MIRHVRSDSPILAGRVSSMFRSLGFTTARSVTRPSTSDAKLAVPLRRPLNEPFDLSESTDQVPLSPTESTSSLISARPHEWDDLQDSERGHPTKEVHETEQWVRRMPDEPAGCDHSRSSRSSSSDSDADVAAPFMAAAWPWIPVAGWRWPRKIHYSQLDPIAATTLIGKGEFADVHRTRLDGSVAALKVINSEKANCNESIDGLKRESLLLTDADHQNIQSALGFGHIDSNMFVLLPLLPFLLRTELPRPVETVPFWVHRREVRQWPISRALGVGMQIGSALRYCHHEMYSRYRVIHRDVKPDNIGFRHDGTAVLFGFGMCTCSAIRPSEGGADANACTPTDVGLPKPLTAVPSTSSLR